MIVAVAILGGVGLVAVLTVKALRDFARVVWQILGPCWYWFSGHSMDGMHRTNATWFKPSYGERSVYDIRRGALRWHHWPRIHRAGYRTGGTVASLVIVYGLVTATFITVVSLCCAAGLALGLGVWRAVYVARNWQHQRHYVRPLEGTLLRGIPARPTMLQVERAGNTIKGVVIEWPHDTEIGQVEQQHVLEAVTARLALEAPEPAWKLKGRQRSVMFTPSDPPPSRLTWDDVADEVEQAKPSEMVTGLGKKRAPVAVSAELDSPHFALAMGSGGGKSNTAAFWLVQRLMRGDLALILDAKYFSHPWAFKDMDAEVGLLPNVAYARTTEDLHNAMVWLGVELQRRTEAAMRAVNAKGDILGHLDNIGPRLWIVGEELNLATPRLKQYWSDVRGQVDGAPKRSPALDGLGAVAFAGRAVKMHLIVIGQMLTAASLGGGDVRENMGVRCLARYSANSWKMQAGDLPMPPPSDIPGRVQVIASGTVREAQVPLMDLQRVRQLALSGVVTPCPADMPGASRQLYVPPRTPIDVAPDQGIVLGQPALPPRATIREALESGLFDGRTVHAARKAIQRAQIEPAGKRGAENEYLLSDLYALVRGISDDH